MHSFQVSHKAVDERLADSVGVSTIRVDLMFERNTPKLNLTLYVPIFILLSSIIMREKSLFGEKPNRVWNRNQVSEPVLPAGSRTKFSGLFNPELRFMIRHRYQYFVHEPLSSTSAAFPGTIT